MNRRKHVFQVYELQIRGHISPVWYDWCQDAIIEHLEDGYTRVIIHICDQAALHGLLSQIQSTGMEIVSLNQRTENH